MPFEFSVAKEGTVHFKLSIQYQGCGRWGHRPRRAALAGVPTSQRVNIVM